MRRVLAVLLVIVIVFYLTPTPAYATVGEPSVSAESAVLLDSASGDVLFSKNSDSRMGMASTTKIMTALVAVENCDIKKKIEISPLAVGIEGSSIYLYAKEQFTIEELLYALLLRSANDAAAAIAIAVGGSIESFAEMMNERAEQMGLKNTHFTNPHGLSDDDHYTSAYDLAIIASCAMKNDVLRKIVSTYKMTIPFEDGTENERFLVNHNKMLKLYDGAIGVKTGFTKATGRCLVSAAERDGLLLIAATLNAPDDWNDHTKMLDFGFDSYESVLIADVGEFSYPLPLVGGDDTHLRLTNTEQIRMTLPKIRGDVNCKIETFHRFEFAPVYPGTELGKVTYSYNKKVFASSSLVCDKFEKSASYDDGLIDKIISFFKKD